MQVLCPWEVWPSGSNWCHALVFSLCPHSWPSKFWNLFFAVCQLLIFSNLMNTIQTVHYVAAFMVIDQFLCSPLKLRNVRNVFAFSCIPIYVLMCVGLLMIMLYLFIITGLCPLGMIIHLTFLIHVDGKIFSHSDSFSVCCLGRQPNINWCPYSFLQKETSNFGLNIVNVFNIDWRSALTECILGNRISTLFFGQIYILFPLIESFLLPMSLNTREWNSIHSDLECIQIGRDGQHWLSCNCYR